MDIKLSEKESDQIRGRRLKASPVCDAADLVDYEELYDELFSRMEHSIGAQIRPVNKGEDNGGDA